MTAFDEALVEHGACWECSRPGREVWHYSGCPFEGRPWSAVPCKNVGCTRKTWRNDGCCSSECFHEYVQRCELASAARGVAAASMQVPGAEVAR